MKIQVIVTYDPNWIEGLNTDERNRVFHDEQRHWRTGKTTVGDVLYSHDGNVVFRLIQDDEADVEALKLKAQVAAKEHRWSEVTKLCRAVDALIEDPDEVEAFYGALDKIANQD